MGNCTCTCCGKKKQGYDAIPGNDDDGGGISAWFGSKNKSNEPSSEYTWEQNVMLENVMKSGKVFRAAIVSFPSGELRAVGPRDFRPEPKATKTIIAALKGDTGPISEEGINLGGGCRQNTAGKLDEGKAIYGSDGEDGGCAIFKTKECVLIVVFNSEPAAGTRLAAEVAEYMEDNDK